MLNKGYLGILMNSVRATLTKTNYIRLCNSCKPSKLFMVKITSQELTMSDMSAEYLRGGAELDFR